MMYSDMIDTYKKAHSEKQGSSKDQKAAELAAAETTPKEPRKELDSVYAFVSLEDALQDTGSVSLVSEAGGQENSLTSAVDGEVADGEGFMLRRMQEKVLQLTFKLEGLEVSSKHF